ncbi:MAG: NAD(P)/FAD-dependent oxidoreductase [Deltaproteobacteria bacterium]
MNTQGATSRRIVIVGGGIAGLSAAVRLSQAGLAVTLLEASQLGGAASTRNQGWLHSGGIFALDSPDYARACHAALERTLRFCPDCLEAGVPQMAYLFSRPDTLVRSWTHAWHAAAIPQSEMPLEQVFVALPGIDRARIQHAFRLPDRSIRVDILLAHLAATAQNAGVEIRPATPIKHLIRHGNRIDGVATAAGEEIGARLVILAGGTTGYALTAEHHQQHAGSQHDVELVPLKAHLVSFQPDVGRLPFCIPDADGLNHLPHPPASVFGTNRWEKVAQPDDHTDPKQVELLRTKVHDFFPALTLEASAYAWAGTMMQPLQVHQIETGGAIWPAVIDHSRHAPHIENLLSIYSGRATLWSQLAEETRWTVLGKLDTAPVGTAHPPWADK